MLYLNANEHHEMKILSDLYLEMDNKKEFINWMLHGGNYSRSYPNLAKLHRYDVLGAVLTGEFKHRPSPSSVLENHLEVARTKEPSQAYALQSLFSELESLGFIKEDI